MVPFLRNRGFKLDNRLKKEKDFSRVLKKGEKVYTDSLTLVMMPEKETKVGYAVGKRHGKSVQRNRVKRLLRESFRSSFAQSVRLRLPCSEAFHPSSVAPFCER